jgi:50S ribosome-binding GTPase
LDVAIFYKTVSIYILFHLAPCLPVVMRARRHGRNHYDAKSAPNSEVLASGQRILVYESSRMAQRHDADVYRPSAWKYRFVRVYSSAIVRDSFDEGTQQLRSDLDQVSVQAVDGSDGVHATQIVLNGVSLSLIVIRTPSDSMVLGFEQESKRDDWLDVLARIAQRRQRNPRFREVVIEPFPTWLANLPVLIRDATVPRRAHPMPPHNRGGGDAAEAELHQRRNAELPDVVSDRRTDLYFQILTGACVVVTLYILATYGTRSEFQHANSHTNTDRQRRFWAMKNVLADSGASVIRAYPSAKYSVDRFNVFVFGKTGVGKSTTIGELTGHKLGSSGYAHDTVDMKAYRHVTHRSEVGHIRIDFVDTRGIMDVEYGMSDLFRDAYKFKHTNRTTSSANYPSKLIVMIAGGKRLLSDEIALLKQAHAVTNGTLVVAMTYCHPNSSPREFLTYAHEKLHLQFVKGNIICLSFGDSESYKQLVDAIASSPTVSLDDLLRQHALYNVYLWIQPIFGAFGLNIMAQYMTLAKLVAYMLCIYSTIQPVFNAVMSVIRSASARP